MGVRQPPPEAPTQTRHSSETQSRTRRGRYLQPRARPSLASVSHVFACVAHTGNGAAHSFFCICALPMAIVGTAQFHTAPPVDPPPAPVHIPRGGAVWKAVDGPAGLLLLLLAPPCSSNCCQQRHHDHPCCAHLHVGQGTGQGQARRLEPLAVLNKKEKRQSHIRAQSHLPANRLWPPPRPLRHRRRSSQCSRSLWPAC